MNRLSLLLLLICGFASSAAGAREEVWENELQYESRTAINQLIKGFDSTYKQRMDFVRELVQMSRGKLNPLVMRQLRIGLTDNKSQIVQGVIETLARINDPSVLPGLEEELLYNKALDVRLDIILHLPLFCVQGQRQRDELVTLLENNEDSLPQNLVDAMRAPPFNAAGQYDLSMDEDVRGRIENALAWQLEPVAAVIENGLEQRNQDRALTMLKALLAIDLGHTRNAWLDFWRSRGREFASPLQSEILNTQIAACRMLGYMGAEGTENLTARIRWLLSTDDDTARQACLQMLCDIMLFAAGQEEELAARLRNPKVKQPEEIWIKRRQESEKRLQKLIMETAQQYLADRSPEIRMAVVDCLGATGEPEAVPHVMQAMRNDGQSTDMRIHVVKALGLISGAEAERLLEQMAVFSGISVEREQQIDEYQRVRQAFEALGQIMGRIRDNRLHYKDAAASAKAAEFLAGRLADNRVLPGSPRQENGESATIRQMARTVLRYCLQNPSDSYDPEEWRKIYAAILKADGAPK